MMILAGTPLSDALFSYGELSVVMLIVFSFVVVHFLLRSLSNSGETSFLFACLSQCINSYNSCRVVNVGALKVFFDIVDCF